MKNWTKNTIALSLVLTLYSALVAQQPMVSQQRSAQGEVTLIGKEQANGQQQAVQGEALQDTQLALQGGGIAPALSQGAFAYFCLYNGWGFFKTTCPNGAITANSKVFLAISEYATDATVNRFIGSANSMTIHNVTPHNGFVEFTVDTAWTASTINLRVDVLVIP